MRLRLLSAVAALGLLAGHVRGQARGDAFGAMMDDELAPRSWPTGLARPAVLAKRDGSCGDGSHPCSDVNSTSCCTNDSFCIVNTDWNVQCCALGFDCSDATPCDTTRYYGNATTTTTITDSASLTSTSLVTVSSLCVGRTCTGAFYGCPSSLGGACCAFGSQCGTTDGGGGICLATETPSPTTTATSSSNTSTTTSTDPPTIPTGATVTYQHKGLSTGAKAGIAVGVVILAALLLAALTYLCVRRRRSSRSAATTTTAQELPSMTAAARGGAAFSDNGIRPYDAASGPHMSEADGYSYGYAPSSTQASHAEGRTSNGGGGAAGDYFGLGVAPGQDDDDDVVEIGTATVGHRRRPQHVRTGSVPGPGGHGGSETGGSELADTSTRGGGGPASPVDSIAERFELYGDYYGSGATPASGGHDEVFHDAQESVGRHGGSGPSSVLPQPFPTPGSEMSEFGTPSPVSREEAHPRRAV